MSDHVPTGQTQESVEGILDWKEYMESDLGAPMALLPYRFREGKPPKAGWDKVWSHQKECSENRGGEDKGLG